MTTTVHLPGVSTPASRRALAEVATCEVCTAYRNRRASTLAVWTVIYSDRHGLKPIPLLFRYLASVHARHVAGGSLSTRKSTPTRKRDGVSRMTIARACNGCGSDLGNATKDELDAAYAGRELPDVRLECGCFGREERVA